MRPRYIRIGESVMLIVMALAPQVCAQQSATKSTPIILDKVMVVDVEQGKLVPDQRVVIDGNHIRAVGSSKAVKLPAGARVVDARGKYLIPGLWDMHVHPRLQAGVAYPLFVAMGVTGIRDAGSPVPLATLQQWRREILAGMRVGPPRQLISGPSINVNDAFTRFCGGTYGQLCLADETMALHALDSLKAAGVDMIKLRMMDGAMYFRLAAEARRLHIPFGGHADDVTASDASDSGAVIVDHIGPESMTPLDACSGISDTTGPCQSLAEQLRRHGTWLVPTYVAFPSARDSRPGKILKKRLTEFWNGSLPAGNWFHDTEIPGTFKAVSSNQDRRSTRTPPVGLPILAGTDAIFWGETLREAGTTRIPAFSIHAELAMYVADGLTPLAALQTATLNPAKMLHATDSLGTVALGKLADLVLLDADPLADITNTTTIRAVVTNGRYFDRAALDQLLVDVQAKGDERIVEHGDTP